MTNGSSSDFLNFTWTFAQAAIVKNLISSAKVTIAFPSPDDESSLQVIKINQQLASGYTNINTGIKRMGDSFSLKMQNISSSDTSVSVFTTPMTDSSVFVLGTSNLFRGSDGYSSDIVKKAIAGIKDPNEIAKRLTLLAPDLYRIGTGTLVIRKNSDTAIIPGPKQQNLDVTVQTGFVKQMISCSFAHKI
jgi:hypothetical protein